MFRASIAALLVAANTAFAYAAGAAPVQSAVFKPGTMSSGWIDFVHFTNLGIYVPVKINGHDAMVWLWGGPSMIDATFATSIGLQADPQAASVNGVTVQIGDLALENATAKPDDLQAQAYAKIIGAPLVFRLGEEAFDQVAVDIDFANHRVAFLDPKSLIKPNDAIEIPIVEKEGERVVPLSVDGGTPALFEFELGNMNGPLMVTPSFAQAHRLLDGHPTSQRLSGPFTETVVSIGQLAFAGVNFPQTPIAIIPDSQLPPASITGGVGLPLLEKFRLIVDYSHSRIYAIPNAAAIAAPIAKDRIGLILGVKGNNFIVIFVAPRSPAALAGFKKGDEIAAIDGKAHDAWTIPAIVALSMTAAGTTYSFAMPDGSVRRVTAADFF
jgi:hypothetical protein